MSVLSIQPTFPVFTDIDGQPLEDGYIFIGQANQNPITNPISVFFNPGLTVLAGQPIRTIGGYPANAGTPGRLYVNSDYSIQVQNKNGSVVYSSPTATERYSEVVFNSNASQVIYDPAGLGAVPTTVQTKLREIVSVSDFGAVGDGVTDDTVAIQAAVDYVQSFYKPEIFASTSPGPGVAELFIPFGFYRLTSNIIITRSISIRGDGHSEFSTGARLIQFTAAKDHFTVQPIAQGNSVSFENITLSASGNGLTGGACINITRAAGSCASTRIIGCTFGTPQNNAIKVQSCNDLMIHDNLFDVSAVHAISLGTSAAADRVSDCSILGNSFFAIGINVIQLFNAYGIVISENKVFPGVSKSSAFIEGENSLPFQLDNIVISNNSVKGVKVFSSMTAATGVTITGNTGVDLGDGASSARSAIRFTGTCSGVNLTGNTLRGDFGASHFFYTSSGATVGGASIAGNSFVNTGTTASAINVAGTASSTGNVSKNAVSGFTSPCVGQKFFTTGNAIAPGSIASLTSFTFTATVFGAGQGDIVTITPASTTWPVQAGVEVVSFVSSTNTVSIRYSNVTGAPIGVGAHDFGIMVTR